MIKEVRVYDLLDECVMSKDVHQNSNEVLMNVDELRTGIYFVEIISDKNILRQKFVKR